MINKVERNRERVRVRGRNSTPYGRVILSEITCFFSSFRPLWSLMCSSTNFIPSQTNALYSLDNTTLTLLCWSALFVSPGVWYSSACLIMSFSDFRILWPIHCHFRLYVTGPAVSFPQLGIKSPARIFRESFSSTRLKTFVPNLGRCVLPSRYVIHICSRNSNRCLQFQSIDFSIREIMDWQICIVLESIFLIPKYENIYGCTYLYML